MSAHRSLLKKDIHFQPWWRWWWWNLPWRMGYAYQRVIPINVGENMDCREMLYKGLTQCRDTNDQQPGHGGDG